PTTPVDRDLARAREELPLEPTGEPAAGEVVALRKERHLARHDERHEEGVGERDVVARDDRGPALRNMLEPLDPRPEQDAEKRGEKPFDEPVTHPASSPRARRRPVKYPYTGDCSPSARRRNERREPARATM